jgi:predicted  nucleic acid-binding Zn-ribbon protein
MSEQNQKQKTTMIMRHLNFKSKAKTKRTLTHSLRIKTKNFRPNEWAEGLDDFVWFVEPETGELVKLNTLTQDEREAEAERIINNAFAEKTVPTSVKNDHSKYLYKLNSKISSTKKPDKNGFVNEALVSELEYIRDHNPDDFETRINSIEGVKRKNQLITMLSKHHDLAKAVEGTEDRRTAKLHEAFFKFPHQHGVEPDPKRMADCIKDFYATHCPNHNVPLLVVHDDERSEGVRTGAHPHIFVDTKDSVTGERDLSAKLTEAVEKYLAFNPTTVYLWDHDEKEHVERVITSLKPAGSHYARSKLQGIILQDMFMEHTRKHFPELSINFTEDRERRVLAFNEKYADSKQPKADRKHNLNGLLTDDNERLYQELKHNETLLNARTQELETAVSKLAETTAELGVAKQTIDSNAQAIKQQQDSLKQSKATIKTQAETIDENQQTLKLQGTKIDEQSAELDSTTDELKKVRLKLYSSSEIIAKRYAENGKLEAEIKAQRAEISGLKATAQKGKSFIKRQSSEIAKSKDTIKKLEQTVSSQRTEIETQSTQIEQKNKELNRLKMSVLNYESKLHNIKDQITDMMGKYVRLVVGIIANKGDTPEITRQAEELGICFDKSQRETQEVVFEGATEVKSGLETDGFSTTAHDKMFKQMEATIKKQPPEPARTLDPEKPKH